MPLNRRLFAKLSSSGFPKKASGASGQIKIQTVVEAQQFLRLELPYSCQGQLYERNEYITHLVIQNWVFAWIRKPPSPP